MDGCSVGWLVGWWVGGLGYMLCHAKASPPKEKNRETKGERESRGFQLSKNKFREGDKIVEVLYREYCSMKNVTVSNRRLKGGRKWNNLNLLPKAKQFKIAINKLDGKPLLFAVSTKLRNANIKFSRLLQILLIVVSC